jgi:hypothetical protein
LRSRLRTSSRPLVAPVRVPSTPRTAVFCTEEDVRAGRKQVGKRSKTNEAGVQLVEEGGEALEEREVALLDATLAEDVVKAIGRTGKGELGTENGGVLRRKGGRVSAGGEEEEKQQDVPSQGRAC